MGGRGGLPSDVKSIDPTPYTQGSCSPLAAPRELHKITAKRAEQVAGTAWLAPKLANRSELDVAPPLAWVLLNTLNHPCHTIIKLNPSRHAIVTLMPLATPSIPWRLLPYHQHLLGPPATQAPLRTCSITAASSGVSRPSPPPSSCTCCPRSPCCPCCP